MSARKKACRPLKTAGHCDEYPFNTAKQGPGWGDGNFSVKKIVGIENTNDGRQLQIFYSRYRVLVPDGTTRLDGDKYWVSVTGPPPQNP
ncbi:NucA/NucB deoxyribonuclease domain-containing protein [Streptosporangium sp. NBC_01755]|uniref:NucA/NucB deoxyribonuclease domain-containing protein n=1 Tax=Streptosporangium sp. NBC_01755 TaxID=2975949 RepID=UPI003FA35A98